MKLAQACCGRRSYLPVYWDSTARLQMSVVRSLMPCDGTRRSEQSTLER